MPLTKDSVQQLSFSMLNVLMSYLQEEAGSASDAQAERAEKKAEASMGSKASHEETALKSKPQQSTVVKGKARVESSTQRALAGEASSGEAALAAKLQQSTALKGDAKAAALQGRIAEQEVPQQNSSSKVSSCTIYGQRMQISC